MLFYMHFKKWQNNLWKSFKERKKQQKRFVLNIHWWFIEEWSQRTQYISGCNNSGLGLDDDVGDIKWIDLRATKDLKFKMVSYWLDFGEGDVQKYS